MKTSKATFDRLKKMLVYDKMGVGDGFMGVFKTELSRFFKDYFVLDSEVDVKVELDDYGFYRVNISFTAEDTKKFSTAEDADCGIY